MNELMIIIFGMATVRTLIPLSKKENYSFRSVFLALITCWAFYHLIFNCTKITF